MIFVCLGSQQYQFNRLLIKLDELVKTQEITEEIFAQTGSSDYQPQNYRYKPFITQEEYEQQVIDADMVISHGGTGAIIKALKAKKQVIVVPRQAKFGEHADDHQFQIADFMADNGYVFEVSDMDDLLGTLQLAQSHPKTKKFVSSGQILDIIERYIEGNKRTS